MVTIDFRLERLSFCLGVVNLKVQYTLEEFVYRRITNVLTFMFNKISYASILLFVTEV